MRYIAMLLCACGLIYACNQEKKKHVFTKVEIEMIKGLEKTIIHFDTSSSVSPYWRAKILRFNRYKLDSIENQ